MATAGLLVIGDSQWKYGNLYAEKSYSMDVTVISQSGMRVNEVDEPMVLATEFFSDVVIHLGTNNLIRGKPYS